MLQDEIDSILLSHISQDKKITSLKGLFLQHNVMIFSDLDDTITDNHSLLFSRSRYLYYIYGKRYSADELIPVLLSSIGLHSGFLEICKKEKITEVVILSRNEYTLVKKITPFLNTLLEEYDIKIVGSVGSHKLYADSMSRFSFRSKDKLKVIPDASILVSDIFEHQAFKDYQYFVCVDTDVSVLHKCVLNFQKLLLLGLFSLTLLFRGIASFR